MKPAERLDVEPGPVTADVSPAPRVRGAGAAAARWECGSDFGLTQEAGVAELPWAAHPHSLWGSGRDAIRGLFDWGRATQGWKRLLMPSYFCQEVVGSTTRSAPVELYPWSPLDTEPGTVVTDEGDVVFVPAMFGAPPGVSVIGPGIVMEDHSHDLLAQRALGSSADYVIASLRKTLPLPDGGVVWSPVGHPVPDAPEMTAAHASVVLQRLTAMALKQHYLQGHDVEKEAYRSVGLEGERDMSAGDASGISVFSRLRLTSLPVRRWREQKADNRRALASALPSDPRCQLLDGPFAAILVFDSHELRDGVRSALIGERVYPSILWPLERPAVGGIPAEHADLSRRILVLHCDHRYRRADMERVAALLSRALETL